MYVNFLLTLTYAEERMTTHGKGLDFKRSEVLVADYSKIFKIIKNRPKKLRFLPKDIEFTTKQKHPSTRNVYPYTIRQRS